MYQTVIREHYKTGIWDNCALVVEVNRKTDKYRVSYEYVKWSGNSGSLASRRYYMAGKIARRMIKRYALTLHQDGYADLDLWMS